MKKKISLICLVATILLVGGYILWDSLTGGPIATALSNRDELASLVLSFGLLAPAGFILVQIFQTIIAPLPGQVIAALGGYLFGWWGIILSLIGGTIGYLIVFIIARKFGYPLLTKIFSERTLSKLDFVNHPRSALIIFLIFCLPGLPDDAVAYLAGLTRIPIGTLSAMAFVGHVPSTIVSTYIGMGLGGENVIPAVIIGIIIMLILAIAIFYKDKMLDFLRHL